MDDHFSWPWLAFYFMLFLFTGGVFSKTAEIVRLWITRHYDAKSYRASVDKAEANPE